MKKKYLALALTAFLCSHSYAQDSNAKEIDDKYVEMLFRWQERKVFLFLPKPVISYSSPMP